MASAPTVDDLTAGAIRQALAAAAAGRLADACAIGERGLAQGGEVGSLNAMLGMLQSKLGNAERAAQHLRLANQARPKDPVIAMNLATALLQLDRKQDAFDTLTDEVIAADRGRDLRKMRAFVAQSLDDFQVAIADYQQIVASDPQDWESWNNLGNAQRSAGDLSGGVESLRRAASINPDSPPIRLNLATALVASGMPDEAETQLQAMARDFPGDAKPLRELHLLFKLQARDQDALEAIREAVKREPDDLELWLAQASHELALLDHASAESSYREVLRRDPANGLANLGLAVVFELANRTDDLSRLVGEAESRGAGADSLNFIRAFDHRRKREYEQGLEALQKVPAELESARRAHLLGQLEEGAGDADAAFAAFERMNEIQRADPSDPDTRAAAYRENVRRQMAAVTPDWLQNWRSLEIADGSSSPVFLVGFPRSGTTLLDTFLMGHPGIEVLEEEPMLRIAGQVLPDFGAWPTASDDQIRGARAAYFEAAASRTALSPGALLVDKNPLALNGLPLILRLFPDAKIVLALRHPCDVVLSCFATNFKLNDGMASFLRLDTAAELYDLSFSYFEHVRQLMPASVHPVVYERVVEDRDRELRSLFDFLGLDWHDAVLDHETTAKSRGRIKTASYAQVVEPIYKRSAGRWQNYRKHLEPIIPVLKPWIDKFGYEA